MHQPVGSLGQVVEQLPPRLGSWAFALNKSADCDDIEITLLSFVVVGEFVQVSGFVRIRSRPNVRLASVPELSLATADGSRADTSRRAGRGRSASGCRRPREPRP